MEEPRRREPPVKKLEDLFKKIGEYNDGHFEFRRDGRLAGFYGQGILLIFLNHLDNEMMAFLATEIALRRGFEYGYSFYFPDFPTIKLIGHRERKNAVKFYVNHLLKTDEYYSKVLSSAELRETVPFEPVELKVKRPWQI